MTERFAQCCGERRDCAWAAPGDVPYEITTAVEIIDATSIRLIGFRSRLLDPIRIGIEEIYR
jgi:hypothetical protein